MLKKQNRLAEAIQKVCVKKNKGRKKREMKWKPKFERILIAASLGVSPVTVEKWYYNLKQPGNRNEKNLPAYFGISMRRFYVLREKE